jgi:hypothetical protein
VGEVEAGRAAILRGSWEEARLHFQRALEGAETAEALDGLGVAGRSLLDEEAAFEAHERRAETLFQAVNEHPFCPYTKTEVRPLADADGAARRLEAMLAEAQAA